jgi:hypothetical protein
VVGRELHADAPVIEPHHLIVPDAVPEIGQFATIEAMASSLGVDVSPINAHDAVEIERGISAFRTIC